MPGAFVLVRVRWQGPHPTSLPRKRESSGRGSGPCDGDLRHGVGIHASSAWQEIPTTAGCIDTDLHPQVEVTPASQANLSSRSHTCIMQKIAHVHHAMRVMFTETCCQYLKCCCRGLAG